MTKIKIDFLVWDEANLNHIKKHFVSKTEIENAVLDFIYHEHTYSGRYLIVGDTGKRILSVVVSRKSLKTYYVVTARSASKKERKKINEKQNI